MAQKQVRSGRGSDAPEPVSPVTGDAVKDESRRLHGDEISRARRVRDGDVLGIHVA